MTDYAELHCLSNFSFLRGASHPEELVERAYELGYAALAVTDGKARLAEENLVPIGLGKIVYDKHENKRRD